MVRTDLIGKSISIQNVSKNFGPLSVLKNVSLDVNPGEFVTILGSSGCGKTTLLRIIAGFECASSGLVFVDGEDLTEKKPYTRNIGVLFQNYALFPHLSVYENIAYPLRVRKLSKECIADKVNEIMEIVHLSGLEKRYPTQLSGGQQQRVALARAVVFNPPLLLLDEPFSALDLKLRHNMQLEVKEIQERLGITTISVTHDQEEAMTMSDRICIIHNGEIQQYASPSDIYNTPVNRYVADFMGSINLFPCKMVGVSQIGKKYVYSLKSTICDKEYTVASAENAFANMISGTQCYLAIRPEQLYVNEDGTCENTFCATVKNVIYLGDRIRVDLVVENDLPLIMKVPSSESSVFTVGKELYISFFQEGPCVVFD